MTATDEVWRLQRESDPECQFFQTAVAGRAGRLGGSHQGTYVFSPNGKLLARINSLSADRVLAVLDRGLAEWASLPDAERHLKDPSQLLPRHRWENSYPKGGLVLESIHRDLTALAEPTPTSQPATPPTGQPNAVRAKKPVRWNRDHVWFHRSEVEGWIPNPPEPGTERTVAAPLVLRLAQFHLVDNVRGQEGPFAPADIQHAEMQTRVVSVEGSQVQLEITGRTSAESDGEWKLGENDWKHFPNRPRSLTTSIVGRATYDRDLGQFSRFELVAIGDAQGGSGLNGRRKKSQLGFLMRLAPDTPQHRIAPAFADIYGTSWITQPAKAEPK